jgi:TonB family protein
MFDKLIESEPQKAEFRSRRRYFVMSSVVVGILFTSAVVYSIYAADIGLGTAEFELVELVAPLANAPAAPEPVHRPPARGSALPATSSDIPTRRADIANINEAPRAVPTAASVVANDSASRALGGRYRLHNFDSDLGSASGGAGRGNDGVGEFTTTGLRRSEPQVAAEREIEAEPPPVRPVKEINKSPVIRSLGVVNGKAVNLPTPPYPAPARAVGAQGQVHVQVMIDDSGRVVSANAVSGHPLLRQAAEQAARGARFSPTTLSKVPVRVTGVIIYNFTR